ncbi:MULTISPECIES: hypothetical protein [Vibrio]|nr:MULTISPECIES: hypothetical protein [Vibrio]NAW56074.1 hypothetical protein [Vibrio sp. V36_P2S2PM302]NAX23868.1 hypothetical protein [Vibrio sp. V38_P2S17PM301]NAX32506.1 hypothetical protein [Vibrio sp. V37_P2S8PM304]
MIESMVTRHHEYSEFDQDDLKNWLVTTPDELVESETLDTDVTEQWIH